MELLIVDDGQYVVEYLKHLLDWKKFGMEHVETTTNPAEARALIDSGRFNLVISDIRMPEISGLDLLEHIYESRLHTKVIFLSGYSQFDYAQKAIRFGALDYLLKPVDQRDMETAMTQATKHLQEHDPSKYDQPEPKVSPQNVVRVIQAYIADHLGEPLSLEDLGRIVHLHPVYLSRLYKQETSENLSTHILGMRLERSARLLENSTLHVVDIARMVGYRKPQYFIKLFKERYGTTPYQYRRGG
ncbi:response regulator transcription factor [Saccharibacillus sacchari]|uniref:response regulator transcription factor n=1 Tax=Saccharibacillus sacchari TaxID=456493 RepID=UPI0004B92C58|nr:response regulator [Saccharibacillus sacchari]